MSMPLDELLYELLHGIEDGQLPMAEQQRRMAELMARRGSQGFGRGLHTSDVETLLARLEKSTNPSFTPSGSPIMAELTMEELRSKLMKNYS